MLILSNEAYKKSKQNNDETREAVIPLSAHDKNCVFQQEPVLSIFQKNNQNYTLKSLLLHFLL
jgi:hypothetical protein